MKNLSDEILYLEECLLHSDMSASPSKIDDLLAADFEEISPAGQITSRESVVAWLLGKDINARWDLQDFKLKNITEGLVLVSYKALQVKPKKSTSLGSLRSSLWRRNASEENWQMIFHQATKIL